MCPGRGLGSGIVSTCGVMGRKIEFRQGIPGVVVLKKKYNLVPMSLRIWCFLWTKKKTKLWFGSIFPRILPNIISNVRIVFNLQATIREIRASD
jgi:hypothetical protein